MIGCQNTFTYDLKYSIQYKHYLQCWWGVMINVCRKIFKCSGCNNPYARIKYSTAHDYPCIDKTQAKYVHRIKSDNFIYIGTVYFTRAGFISPNGPIWLIFHPTSAYDKRLIDFHNITPFYVN